MFDILIIGGGVIGGTIMREATKYNLKVALLEKENDVCMGQSKANSGIVHAGFDAMPNTLKAKFNVLGNQMMPNLAKELGVKYINNGALVVAFTSEDCDTLERLYYRGVENGVTGLELIDRERLNELEPNVSKNALMALHAKTSGIICPYELTIASIGNAMDNGAKLYTQFEVNSIKKDGEEFIVSSTNGQTVKAKVVVNCAGINSGKIAKMIGDDYIEVKGRKGDYILLDRESKDFVNHTLFFTPTKKGKGILVTQTVDGNILLGPTSTEIEEISTKTDGESLNLIIQKAREMTDNPPLYNSITSFTGVRAYCNRHDFIIEESKSLKGFIHLAGIESPGLTSAPAIAKHVIENVVSNMLTLTVNSNFNGKRTPDYFFKNLSIKEKNEIIKKDDSYGKIVCRCEQITEGEIIRALTENPPANDIDGVKRRTRAGMGRCQGGFCQPYVAELIAKVKGVNLEDVTKKGKNSKLLVGKTK